MPVDVNIDMPDRVNVSDTFTAIVEVFCTDEAVLGPNIQCTEDFKYNVTINQESKEDTIPHVRGWSFPIANTFLGIKHHKNLYNDEGTLALREQDSKIITEQSITVLDMKGRNKNIQVGVNIEGEPEGFNLSNDFGTYKRAQIQ